jgi:sulfite reductase alpha subunit-like flavoprotein
MMVRLKQFALVLALAAPFLLRGAAGQQSPAPIIVVQAANTGTNQDVAKPVSPDNSSASLQAAFKALQQTKTINDETLKKQEALLEQLDELQKAAEQLKIFAKRG